MNIHASRSLLGSFGLVALLAGCDSSSNDAGGAGGVSSTAGPTSGSTGTSKASSSGASPTTVSSNVSTVGVSASDSSTTSGNHPDCMHAPFELMDWSIALPGGAVIFPDDLDAETNLALPLEGEIVSLNATGFVVDTCPPNADCLPSLVDFDFSVVDANDAAVGPNGLPLTLGGFVAISGHTDVIEDVAGYPQAPTTLRTMHLEVHNLETWGGVTNPVEPGDALLMIVSANGLPHATLPPGLTITNERTCAPVVAPSMEIDTAITVGLGGTSTVVVAGETRAIDGGPPDLEAWNVASYLSNASGLYPPQFFLFRNDTP